MESFITLASVLAISLLLYFLLTWLAKTLMPSNGKQNRKITTIGLIFGVTFVVILFAVFLLEYMAPNITDTQRYLIAVFVVAIAVVAENILKKMGIKMSEDNDDKNV